MQIDDSRLPIRIPLKTVGITGGTSRTSKLINNKDLRQAGIGSLKLKIFLILCEENNHFMSKFLQKRLDNSLILMLARLEKLPLQCKVI